MTKIIVLAAGQGTRLRPLTDKLPKALVKLGRNSILDEQLCVYRKLKLADITVVGGYQINEFKDYNFKLIQNKEFEESNMVYSLFCAHEYFNGKQDIIVAYGDIVFQPEVLEGLIQSNGDVVVTADREWLALWRLRMEEPLSDAETFKINSDGNYITELGNKPKSLADIQAQYIGLVKFSKRVTKKVYEYYLSLRNQLADSAYKNMYFTDFIQLLIENDVSQVNAHFIERGWLEVDSIEDLDIYRELLTQCDYATLGFTPRQNRENI